MSNPGGDYGRRMPMDRKMVREIEALGDQGGSWLNEWGGVSGYRYWAQQPVVDRMTYFAVSEGYDTSKDIADVTGLRESDVSRSLGKLQAAGLIEEGVVVG